MANYASTPQDESLANITEVWRSRDESLLSPPGLAVRLADGGSFEFRVLASRLAPNFLSNNRRHRDEMLEALRLALQNQGAG